MMNPDDAIAKAEEMLDRLDRIQAGGFPTLTTEQYERLLGVLRGAGDSYQGYTPYAVPLTFDEAVRLVLMKPVTDA
jgi:hypothetical protein